MVTRNPAFEKREDRLSLHIQVNQAASIPAAAAPPAGLAANPDVRNAQFHDRAGACKLVETAVNRGDQTMTLRLTDCRANRSAAPPSGGAGRMIDAVTKPRTKVRTKTERPRLHKVILINDDFTPREFVVTVLKAEFRMTEDQAHKVMITAHRLGVCVVAVFTRDVAETKATRATDAGRAKGYPLLFTTEPEE
jgi:ATP-dependent Clp protease adaptor protein ClpS